MAGRSRRDRRHRRRSSRYCRSALGRRRLGVSNAAEALIPFTESAAFNAWSGVKKNAPTMIAIPMNVMINPKVFFISVVQNY